MGKKEVMSPTFAVFNLHVNKAREKADREFKRMFGEKKYDRHIARIEREGDGIMHIFNVKPNEYRMAWVAMVTVLVNEGRA